MIRPPGLAGAAFGTAATGDLRVDAGRRRQVAAELGIPPEWAFLRQVHGADIVLAKSTGDRGAGDALITQDPQIPVAVATADCVPVVVIGDGVAAVIHAGWRGALAGVVPATLRAMEASGHPPRHAAIGPAIGPCCYEVGEDVAAQFPGFIGSTTWDTVSVDVPGFVRSQLAGLKVWMSGECTFTSDRLYSWRQDGTNQRQIAVAWLPTD